MYRTKAGHRIDDLPFLLCLTIVSVAQLGSDELAVQAGDVAYADALGALGLAGAGVGAVTETKLIHLGEHSLGAAGSLNLTLREQSKLANLGTYKQHRRTVLAGCYAGTATDA